MVDYPEWLTLTAWQGGGSRIRQLVQTGPGRFRTREPVPVHGEWKTLIRLHRGRSMVAVPIYLPADPGIPAFEVPAEERVTRRFISDKKMLLREAKTVAPGLTVAATSVLVAIALAWLGAIAWVLRRLRPPPPRGAAAFGGSAGAL
ncbi:MAG: hypothetical protein ABR575_04335 [Actinomycetota bacterium]